MQCLLARGDHLHGFRLGDERPMLRLSGFSPARIHARNFVGRAIAPKARVAVQLHVVVVEPGHDSGLVGIGPFGRLCRTLESTALLGVRQEQTHTKVTRLLAFDGGNAESERQPARCAQQRPTLSFKRALHAVFDKRRHCLSAYLRFRISLALRGRHDGKSASASRSLLSRGESS